MKGIATQSTYALILTGLLSLFSAPALALDPVYSNFLGQAIRGYDPVAYFSEGRPVEGTRTHRKEWNGSTWYFSSAENLKKFSDNPQQYAPQFGGYCAWAVSQGYTASIDPEAWTIHDNKLYLNYSKDVQRQWSEDIPGNINKGNQNWPGLLAGK